MGRCPANRAGAARNNGDRAGQVEPAVPDNGMPTRSSPVTSVSAPASVASAARSSTRMRSAWSTRMRPAWVRVARLTSAVPASVSERSVAVTPRTAYCDIRSAAGRYGAFRRDGAQHDELPDVEHASHSLTLNVANNYIG